MNRTVRKLKPYCIALSSALWLASVALAQQNDNNNSENRRPALPAGYVNIGATTPENTILFEANGQASYDDNVFANNADRVGDMFTQLGAHVGMNIQASRGSFLMDYFPTYIFYANHSGYDSGSHELHLDGQWFMTRHWQIEAQDFTVYRSGLFGSYDAANFTNQTSGLDPSLNTTIYAPLARELSNQARVNVRGQLSKRSEIDVWGAFLDRNFGSVANAPTENLLDTSGGSGGMQYKHQVSRDVNVGVSYTHQHLTFGSSSRATFDDALLNIEWAIRPTLTLSVFGGGQHTSVLDSFSVLLPLPGGPTVVTVSDAQKEWHGIGGGSVAKQFRHALVEVSAQRGATDGGGLLTSVMNTSESGHVQWGISRMWGVDVYAENAESVALSGILDSGSIRSQRVGVGVYHQFTSALGARFGYDFIRQRTDLAIPIVNNMDRDVVSFRLIYRFHEIPIGR